MNTTSILAILFLEGVFAVRRLSKTSLLPTRSPGESPELYPANGPTDTVPPEELSDNGPTYDDHAQANECMSLAIQIAHEGSQCEVPSWGADSARWGANYFFIDGSALGVWRDGGVCEGDDDVDIAIPRELVPCAREAMDRHKIDHTSHSDTRHWGLYAGKCYISFWGYEIRSSPEYEAASKGYSQYDDSTEYVCFGGNDPSASWRDAYPKDMLLPSTEGNAFQLKLPDWSPANLPRDPDSYLSLRYGKDWRTPKPHDDAGAKMNTEEGYRRYDMFCANSSIGEASAKGSVKNDAN